MSEQAPKSDLEYSRQLQEKFELYLLALIFTLLGLAIQTAKFGSVQAANALELLGWFSLLLSGLVGLSRLEWLPVAYKTHWQLTDLKAEHYRLTDAAERGIEQLPVIGNSESCGIHELISDRAEAIQKVESRVGELEKATQRKYSIHKWSFAVGLVLLIGARGYEPIAVMFRCAI